MSPAARVGHTVAMWGAEMYVFGGGDSSEVCQPTERVCKSERSRARARKRDREREEERE